jgi:hypothetical protein
MADDKEVKKPGDVEEEPKVQNELSDTDLENVAGAGNCYSTVLTSKFDFQK